MKHLLFSFFILYIGVASAVELTFELADNQKQCFHEDIQTGVKSNIDFQVIDGGNYDVDMTLEAPSGKTLITVTKTQSETNSFTAQETGVYTVCFSNEFSTFSHKLIYMDFEVGGEKPLPGLEEHPTMTKMESSSENIHNHLNTIVDYQTYHRLMEAKGRHFAEELNSRVFHWSVAETFAMFIIGFVQVVILRSFFSDRK